MRILLLTLGSRGDVEPFIALALGLQRAGHEPTLCTSTRFAPEISARGLEHAAMSDGFVELLESAQGRAGLERSGTLAGMLRTVRQLAREVGPLQLQIQRDCWAAAQRSRPELILHHLKIVGAADIAEQLGVPAFLLPLVPMVQPTAARVCPVMADLPIGPPWDLGLRSVYRRQGYRLVNQLATRFGAGPVKRWRQERGLPPRPRAIDLLHDAQGRPVPLLHGHSELLVPRPADWPPHAAATGFWRLPASTGWAPPPALQAFLDAGEAPVYVGFGSMAGRDPQRLAALVIEALRLAGVRGVLAQGWGGLKPGTLPPGVHLIEQAPHDALLPRMAAVVHHGGAGTTAAGLLAGRPTVICPFFGDQPFWGRQVHERGLGPAPLPQRRLTAQRLAAAIDTAVRSVPVREAAAALGARLRAEDGVGAAVALVERWAAAWPSTPRGR
jgi:sterol 3beta-glucosyltransferase